MDGQNTNNERTTSECPCWAAIWSAVISSSALLPAEILVDTSAPDFAHSVRMAEITFCKEISASKRRRWRNMTCADLDHVSTSELCCMQQYIHIFIHGSDKRIFDDQITWCSFNSVSQHWWVKALCTCQNKNNDLSPSAKCIRSLKIKPIDDCWSTFLFDFLRRENFLSNSEIR